jgi:hypothetical protein
MRRALRFQQTELNALELKRIRNEWVGHGGRPGMTVGEGGEKELHYGRGIGNNYWDLLPFGWDDMYSTSQYYTSALIMAELEAAIRRHPEWEVPVNELAFDPAQLRAHAAEVKQTANELFWNEDTGRFIASIDMEGKRRDYGFTFVNLDAIWYGIASERHAQEIMDWITGKRIVEGDTSQGEDIYRWRFGPRATTLRNIDWYGQGWIAPEDIPFGGQIQDGGAVLGFSFYDLWARLKVVGADNAWDRLQEILAWERDVWSEGGYRPYYEGGKRGTTLQGGGTAGGIGIDAEFWESSLIPSILVYGFLGIEPNATDLVIRPKLPEDCPELGVSGLWYRDTALDVKAGPDYIEVAIKEEPVKPLQIDLEGEWSLRYTDYAGSRFALHEPGVYRFER